MIIESYHFGPILAMLDICLLLIIINNNIA